MQRLWIAAVGVVGLLAISFAQDPADLSWRFKIGESNKYIFRHKEIRKAEIGNLKPVTTTEAEFDFLWTVQDVDASGVATLDAKVNALRFTTAGDNFDYGYDSTRGNLGDSDYHKRLIGVLDQIRYAGKYQLRIDPTGQLLAFTGLSKVLSENNPGLNILDYHGVNLHDTTFAWFLQQAMGRLPGKDDANKAKWDTTTENSLGDFGSAVGQIHATLGKKDADGFLHIDWTGSQSADLNMRWLGAEVKGTLKTTKHAGSLRFDPRTSRLQRGTARIDLAGDLKVGGGMFKMAFQHELELAKQP